MHNHLSLYADDVIIFLLQSEKSISILLDLIKSFGEVSGYAINGKKSKFMSLGADLDVRIIFLSKLQMD